ncbi:isopenicillin N synthase family dioxygenase [Novosphingobium nitrogenifigens]|nr:2-oxoglutarate and iron-dependent oxygenase domain-containing protein [Novosphingobium nitrogenifigens]
MMLTDVPTIDLTPYRLGTEEGKRAVAEAVGKACTDIGFLVISGHGVPQDLIERTYAVSRRFFALPASEKALLNRPQSDQVRGYSAVGDEGLSYSLGEVAPPDLKESLSIGPLNVPADDPYYHNAEAGPHFAPNLWPESLPELKTVWSEYFAEMERLSCDLMRIFALALDLPENWFDPTGDRHISMFRALHYPNQPDAPLDGQMRAGAHSDYGALTILRQENVPGSLQVCNREGNWVDVPAIPGTFVVNIGDLMMQWTNDKWISTLHRVVNPPRDLADQASRVSLVYFYQPNYDAVVSCLDSCQSPDQPARYPPITSGDHLTAKFVQQTTLGGTKDGAETILGETAA